MIPSGMPSGPGALPIGILLALSIISKGVISGNVFLSYRLYPFVLTGIVMPGISFLPINLFVTILKGSPHGSKSTCLHSNSQLLFLLFSISFLSSFCASL